MFKNIRPIAAVMGLGLVAGCTAGNGALEPGFTSVNLTTNKLQLAVGVATFTNGSKGLNAVATFRQPNGLSATLLNTPTMTGPFTVPTTARGTNSATAATANFATCTPNLDAGLGQVTASAQALPGTTATCTTLGQGGGVFAYGFAPENSTTAQAPSYLLFGDGLIRTTNASYGGPFYGAGTLLSDGPVGSDPTAAVFQFTGAGYGALRGGPPAYPFVRTGTFPANFLGYTLGYTTFAVPPVAGAYNLSVNIPSANNAGATIAAPTATLSNATGLPVFAASPTFTEDGAGGGTATCTAPAGVTETLVELVDEGVSATAANGPTSYYTAVVQGGGLVSAVFGSSMGPLTGTGVKTPSVVTGDAYEVSCIGADYPLYEAGPPQNTSQTPTIVGASGQADITFAPPFDGTYGGAPAAAAGSIKRR